ncbi:hypothetical protein N0V91_008384 [Didymella pomorum]|uniref:Uncharacterized protein n=1 Tax=Didymella pomorum TaxID=749634 RepID=A0A9W8Z993_9PLEO|nr:hypothetical protein N0V91_008384 [Didymella pomorum]
MPDSEPSTKWQQSYKDDPCRISLLDLPRELRDIIYAYTFHVTEASYRIFNTRDLDATSHGWRNRFWPAILDSAGKMLTQFPNVESITMPMKPFPEPHSQPSLWRPAFFDLGGRTADRRIELAAEWMLDRTNFPDERLRDCLHLELEPSPNNISREEYFGSRFAPDEEEWDYAEFGHAFELMKALD